MAVLLHFNRLSHPRFPQNDRVIRYTLFYDSTRPSQSFPLPSSRSFGDEYFIVRVLNSPTSILPYCFDEFICCTVNPSYNYSPNPETFH